MERGGVWTGPLLLPPGHLGSSGRVAGAASGFGLRKGLLVRDRRPSQHTEGPPVLRAGGFCQRDEIYVSGALCERAQYPQVSELMLFVIYSLVNHARAYNFV